MIKSFSCFYWLLCNSHHWYLYILYVYICKIYPIILRIFLYLCYIVFVSITFLVVFIVCISRLFRDGAQSQNSKLISLTFLLVTLFSLFFPRSFFLPSTGRRREPCDRIARETSFATRRPPQGERRYKEARVVSLSSLSLFLLSAKERGRNTKDRKKSHGAFAFSM